MKKTLFLLAAFVMACGLNKSKAQFVAPQVPTELQETVNGYVQTLLQDPTDETVMKSTSERENHHYKLGLEVLRDMYTLSCCNGIIAGLSNVSIFARIVKLSRGCDFEFMNYLNKGIKR